MLGCQNTNSNCTLRNAFYQESWNCTHYQSCREQANNDIAGFGVRTSHYRSNLHHVVKLTNIQVLLAFVSSAFATLIIAWVSYIVQPVDGALGELLNVLDKNFLEWLWKGAKRAPTMSSRWTRVF